MNGYLVASGALAVITSITFLIGLANFDSNGSNIEDQLHELGHKTKVAGRWQLDMPEGGFAYSGEEVDIDDAVSLILQHLEMEITDGPSLQLKPIAKNTEEDS